MVLRLTSGRAELHAAAADGDPRTATPVRASDEAAVLVVAASEDQPTSPSPR